MHINLLHSDCSRAKDSKTDEAILPGTLGALFLPLLTPSDLHPTALESTDERFIQAAECLASITSRKTPASVWTAPFSPAVADFAYPYNAQDTSSPIAALLALIEHANGGEEEEYAKSKAQLAYALVDLGSVLPLIPTPAPLTTSSSPTSTTLTSATLQDVTTLRKAFDTLCAWTAPLRRDDLRMSALLTIGNAITSNSICVALLSTPAGDELARNAIQALQGTDQVQHAAMGFLRNLSVPLENKAKLGKRAMGIWDGLVQADVWGEGKDMLGSVQGGAVGLVKNLCRDTRASLCLSTIPRPLDLSSLNRHHFCSDQNCKCKTLSRTA